MGVKKLFSEMVIGDVFMILSRECTKVTENIA